MNRSGVGLLFAQEFEKTVSLVVSNPRGFPKVQDNVRACVVRRFKQRIYYLLLEDSIVILGVYHFKFSDETVRRKLKQAE